MGASYCVGHLVSVDDVLVVPPVRLTTVPGFDTAVFSFTTDIPWLDRWGKPLLLGPGSVTLAHTSDEYCEIAELTRPDECCGFGGTFAVGEPAVSTKMGRDKLRDVTTHGAQAVVSTDMSCLMHLDGLARRERMGLPMYHVAEVLAGMAGAR